jgi:hypothetical protein
MGFPARAILSNGVAMSEASSCRGAEEEPPRRQDRQAGKFNETSLGALGALAVIPVIPPRTLDGWRSSH